MATSFASSNGTIFLEGQSTHRPPLFNGTNYNYWKARMKIFLQTNYSMWKVILEGPKLPTKTVDGVIMPKDEKDWTSSDIANIELNAKAMNMLYCALDSNEFNRVSACETAKEIWDKLEVTHEGTNQVKESKIDMLVHKYELFKMMPYESISDMFTRFTDIINGLKSLGKVYSNIDLVRKVLRSLPKEWDPKVTAIIEAKQDLTNYSLDELLGSLMTHEITMNKDEDQGRKEKSLAFKVANSKADTGDDSDSSSSNDGDDSETSESDEEIYSFTRKFKKLMRRKKEKGKKVFKKDGYKNEVKKDPIICYECKKPGHVRPKCPHLKKLDKKAKRIAMLAAWGNSSDDDSSNEENEQANLCLMTHKSIEVKSLEDDSFTYDELLNASYELHD